MEVAPVVTNIVPVSPPCRQNTAAGRRATPSFVFESIDITEKQLPAAATPSSPVVIAVTDRQHARPAHSTG
jgi:hypothetical protein